MKIKKKVIEKFADDLLPTVKAILQEAEIFSYPLCLVSKLSQHGVVSKCNLYSFFAGSCFFSFLLHMNNSGTPS